MWTLKSEGLIRILRMKPHINQAAAPKWDEQSPRLLHVFKQGSSRLSQRGAAAAHLHLASPTVFIPFISSQLHREILLRLPTKGRSIYTEPYTSGHRCAPAGIAPGLEPSDQLTSSGCVNQPPSRCFPDEHSCPTQNVKWGERPQTGAQNTEE